MFKEIDRKWLAWAIVVGLVLISTITGVSFPIPPIPQQIEDIDAQGVSGGISNFTGIEVAAPTVFATATPAMLINNEGLGNALEIQNAGTPVFYVDTAGNTTISGTCTGCSINAGSGLRIVQPTAGATATPALAINSLAAGAKLLEVSDASTPVFNILNGGAWSSTGAGTHSSGQTVNNFVKAAAPTAVATATPAMVVDSLALSNIFEVRDAATPVFAINDGGNIARTGDDAMTGDLAITGNLSASGTADFNGVVDAVVGTEHLGLPSIVSTAITFTAVAGGTGTVATVGASEIWLVHGVYVNVTTNFDCTGDDTTLVIGDGNDPNGFCDLADAELQAADTEATGFAAGWQCQVAATIGVYTDESQDFIYDGTDTIDWLVDEASGESITAGAATIYVVYTRIQ